jgi:hypothetical protein
VRLSSAAFEFGLVYNREEKRQRTANATRISRSRYWILKIGLRLAVYNPLTGVRKWWRKQKALQILVALAEDSRTPRRFARKQTLTF